MSKRKATKRQEAVHPPEIQRFLEWQEKQYLPGYYTGGRIPPIFYGKRPNKLGYLLLLTGSATLIMVGLALWPAFTAATLLEGSRPLLITGLIGLLQLIAGWRLLQGRNDTGRGR